MQVPGTVTFEFDYPSPLNKPWRCETLIIVYIFLLINKEQQKQIDELKTPVEKH